MRGGDDGGTTGPKERRTVHDLIQRERLAGPVGPDDRGREHNLILGQGSEVLEGPGVGGQLAGRGVRGGHELEGRCERRRGRRGRRVARPARFISMSPSDVRIKVLSPIFLLCIDCLLI